MVGVLTQRSGDEDLVIAPPAYRARGEASGGQLGMAQGATASQLGERGGLEDVPVTGQDGPRLGIHMQDVIVRAAVLVRVLERPPPGRERQSAIATAQVPEVRHP